jgi:preprotein translocase subunit SecA
VVSIPTNRAISRKDQQDLVYKTKREKYKAVIDEIEALRGVGRPVLVGTTSVEVSELLSRMLQQKKVPHNVLNAKQHEREATIVAEAGLAGRSDHRHEYGGSRYGYQAGEQASRMPAVWRS